ncbi:MAG: Gldg family protein [Proteobacteria bacterium]|nr:Gldg family protein [Pseudomonadota bacterium]MBU1688488.1 Gldg family protein [Pseudomonadota bacterium]
MIQIVTMARKELKAYFGSPMAAIFIGAFLLSTMFSFFWVETFFARNIADIRPLFRWMPILMIFLVAALTMRQWSEEQKMGTLEVLLTLPVKVSRLVLGKFLAVLSLVGVALLLTGGLPITVSFLGDLDWGPVMGGYLATMLMASTYIAIGLYVSSRTDNQIIALIISVMICGLFYLAGSTGITNFMGNDAGEFFRALGTGSRFTSIERGVIDLRDLVYYTSLTGFFLVLNVTTLIGKGWSDGENTARYRRNVRLGVWLLAGNLLCLNIWLHGVPSARLDLTEQREYSISDTTRDLIENLQEPLVMRGYFSEKTHPLLAPLVPRIKDLMSEYRHASGGRIEVSFLDPRFDEEAEMEANQQYAIKPVPFQVAGRYEASVVNSYFNILIKYGDQYVTLGFNDLIEVQARPDGQLDVGLRNLEYDLTRSIKKVVYGFQSLSSIFEKAGPDLGLTFVASAGTLPEGLNEMAGLVREAAAELGEESGGHLNFTEIDPDSEGASGRERIFKKFGVEPLAASIFSQDTFYFHLMLTSGETTEQIYLNGEMGKSEIRKEIEAALKKTSAGFLKTVGIWLPKAPPSPISMYQPQAADQDQYRLFQSVIRENYNVQTVDLTGGRIGTDIDTLLLVAPQEMSDLERLAVDQYLMRGGSVIALAGGAVLDLTPESRSLNIRKVEGGIAEMLARYGVKVDSALVMDLQNEPFPVPVTRNIGGFTIQEIKKLDYPFFVDVRSDGMAVDNPVTAKLPAVTMNWVSPLTLTTGDQQDQRWTTLLTSSPQSWLYDATDIQPDFQRYPDLGFAEGDSMEERVLAVSGQGVFESYYVDHEDPRQAKEQGLEPESAAGEESAAVDDSAKVEKESLLNEPIIRKSADSARLVVVGSSEFINDTVLGISRSMGQDRFMNSLGFLQNLIDWSVADDDLLTIRSRGAHARILEPLSRKAQTFWEWINYGLALLALVVVGALGSLKVRREEPMQLM